MDNSILDTSAAIKSQPIFQSRMTAYHLGRRFVSCPVNEPITEWGMAVSERSSEDLDGGIREGMCKGGTEGTQE